MKDRTSPLTIKHLSHMWRRFSEAYTLESNKKAGPKPCLILSDEFIPGQLLLSGARFCFNSSMQNSTEETIFTTCRKRQPFTNKTEFGIGHLNLDESHTKRELKFLRNTIYAQYGYQFKDPELQSYFNQFEWYLPDPNLKLEMIALTAREKQFIDEIMKREKE